MPAPISEEQKSRDREVLLDAAEALFYERGIQAVGMDDIRAAAGIADLGITGSDILIEQNCNINNLMDLPFGYCLWAVPGGRLLRSMAEP